MTLHFYRQILKLHQCRTMTSLTVLVQISTTLWVFLCFAVLLVNTPFGCVYHGHCSNRQGRKTSVYGIPEKHASALYLQGANWEFK